MKLLTETITNYAHKPDETIPEQQATQFKSQILDQIPVAKIELQYRPEIPAKQRLKILNSNQAAEVLRALWNPDTIELQEQFNILYLNNSNQVVGFYPHSQGGITGTLADMRLILVAALGCGAVAMILSHNHPSGTTKPSKPDIDLTRKLQKAGNALDIKLLDHIILTKDDYHSFADNDNICF